VVASTIELPNVKRIFLPDPGWFLCDSDLAQADAQVVAWDANDKPLMDFFKAAKDDPELDLHGANAADIFGGPPTKKNKHRKKAKAGVHAVNYDVRARTLATTLGCTIKEAQAFIDAWFTKHPAIYDWQRRIDTDLQTKRIITNRFGNRKVFFGRVKRALPEALAWIPQSTVALVVNRAWKAIEDLNDPDIQVLLQVHDSLVYQVRKGTFRRKLPLLEEAFKVEVPYDDPLIIPAGLDYSDKSWGDCEASDWQGNIIPEAA
jgi:DNA polymerase-1